MNKRLTVNISERMHNRIDTVIALDNEIETKADFIRQAIVDKLQKYDYTFAPERPTVHKKKDLTKEIYLKFIKEYPINHNIGPTASIIAEHFERETKNVRHTLLRYVREGFLKANKSTEEIKVTRRVGKDKYLKEYTMVKAVKRFMLMKNGEKYLRSKSDNT